ncbi:MAG: O-antigen ligase family protein [Oscillospiraceae bacterium]|nr:O-antigen ligase family protein [Oscillospiraceae bacterium]
MTISQNHSPESRRRFALAAAVYLLYMFYMFSQAHFYLYQSLRGTYYSAAVPVVVAGVLYFRRFRDGTEFKLLVFYWLWFLLSRMLNHNLALVDDQYLCFDLSLMLPMFVLGLVLDADGRRRFLDWFSAVAGGYYFLLGLLCLAAFVLRRQFINPITEGLIGMATKSGYERINILDTNVDSTAYWFMTGVLLMLYQFFACRKKLWRIPIVLCALVNWAVIGITYTRSVRVALSVTAGLLAVLLCRRALKGRRKAVLALLLILVFVITAPLIYKSFDLCTDVLSRISESVRSSAEAAQSAPAELAYFVGEDAPVAVPLAAASSPSLYDRLNTLSSKRLEIYRCAFLTIREDPLILLRGCLSKDSMGVTNALLQRKSPVPHFHNFLLQILILTGLPGLALALSFCVLVLRKLLRLLFAGETQIPNSVKVLALSPIASLTYGMFEACFFTDIDIRPLFFFLIGGMALGFYKDLFPKTEN